jgi:GAF domain-containing protein
MKNTFGKNLIPENEEARLKALARYKLLKNLPKNYFTNMANIMAKTFDTPIALVSLVDKDEVLFPGNAGMVGTTQVPRNLSLCSLAILETQPTVFENALEEPCLLTNPLVAGEFGLRFYAGAPIITADGYAIGTVCVVDKEPRSFSENERQMLKGFARTAMQELDFRLNLLY